MLAETVHAAVYGDAQLHACLTAIQDWGPAQMGSDTSHSRHPLNPFTPDKIIKHEREPIGLDDPTSMSQAECAPSTYKHLSKPHAMMDDPAPGETAQAYRERIRLESNHADALRVATDAGLS
jgi:hypothetical protein